MTLIQLLKDRNTTDGLTRLYNQFCRERGYPLLSADELHYELLCRTDRMPHDIAWLIAFIDHWKTVQNAGR